MSSSRHHVVQANLSTVPRSFSVTVPLMEARETHYVTVLLGKHETGISILRPHFAPAPVSAVAALAARAFMASPLRSNREDASEDGASNFAPYVSDRVQSQTVIDTYFSTSINLEAVLKSSQGAASSATGSSSSGLDTVQLASFEWMERVVTSASTRQIDVARCLQHVTSSLSAQNGSLPVTPLQVTVGDPDDGAVENAEPSGASTSDRGLKDPRLDTADGDVIFGISGVQNLFTMAFQASTRIRDVALIIRVHHPVLPQDNVRHPLRMCRMHNVCGSTYDAAVEWISKHRTKLLQGLVMMNEDQCEMPSALGGNSSQPKISTGKTFLHLVVENLGDPRFARMLLKHCSRFLRKDEKELATGRTALQMLFLEPSCSTQTERWMARVVEVGSALYHRTMELLRLLVEEALCSVHEEDLAGNTVVHFAACAHRQGSALLPLLLVMGAPAAAKNAAGRTAAEEVVLRRERQRLMTWDVDDALAILQSHTTTPCQGAVSSSDDVEAATSAQAKLIQRKQDAAALCSNGLDLPRPTLTLVDCVPPPVAPKPNLSNARFPTSVVDVDDGGMPRYGGDPAAPAVGMNGLSSGHEPSRGDGIVDLAGTSGRAAETDQPSRRVMSEATMEQLQHEFQSFDREGQGWVSVADMRRVYLSYEGYGVSESAAEIDKMIRVMGIRRDGRVTFEEYCILMLRLNRR